MRARVGPRPRSGQSRQHFLNFLPLPQGQGSLRPTFASTWTNGSSPPKCSATPGARRSSRSSGDRPPRSSTSWTARRWCRRSGRACRTWRAGPSRASRSGPPRNPRSSPASDRSARRRRPAAPTGVMSARPRAATASAQARPHDIRRRLRPAAGGEPPQEVRDRRPQRRMVEGEHRQRVEHLPADELLGAPDRGPPRRSAPRSPSKRLTTTRAPHSVIPSPISVSTNSGRAAAGAA